jgi:hypothetical protein
MSARSRRFPWWGPRRPRSLPMTVTVAEAFDLEPPSLLPDDHSYAASVERDTDGDGYSFRVSGWFYLGIPSA